MERVKKLFQQLFCLHKKSKVIRTSIMEPVYGPPKNDWERSSILYWKHVSGPWDKQFGPIKENECEGCGHKWFSPMV